MANYSYNPIFLLGKDANSNVTYQIPFTPIGYATNLAAGVEQHFTVPTNVNMAIFSYGTGTDVWVDGSTTAVLPGSSFAASTADLNPVARPVYAGEVLSFICGTAAAVKVSLYNTAINQNI